MNFYTPGVNILKGKHLKFFIILNCVCGPGHQVKEGSGAPAGLKTAQESRFVGPSHQYIFMLHKYIDFVIIYLYFQPAKTGLRDWIFLSLLCIFYNQFWRPCGPENCKGK